MNSLLLASPRAHLRYLDFPGDAPPVVWLHGLGCAGSSDFARVHIPRAYLFGELSLPDPETERLADHGIDVLVVPDAGHDMPFDNPAGLAETVAKALL